MNHLLAILMMMFALTACSTSGKVDTGVDFNDSGKVIYVSSHFSGYEERHIGSVIRTFEKHGFTITNDKNNAQYYLDFVIEGGGIVNVDITLLKDGKPVLSASSSNAGWGTVIARPTAISSRVTQALDKLNVLLAENI